MLIMTLIYSVASKEAVFVVVSLAHSKSICLVFLSEHHAKTFYWSAQLLAFAVKRRRLRQQQAERQLYDTAPVPISVNCTFHVRC